MQFFNQLISQARELFLSMTPGSRFLAGLLLAAVVVSSAFLVQGTTGQSTEYLFAGRLLSESEIDAAEVAFSTAALSEYELIGRRIQVPAAKRHEYMKALAENNAFPKHLGSSIDQALSAQSFLEPIESSRQRIRAAREGDIANAIKSLSFVEDAFVTYDEQRNGFSTAKQQTASVWVRPHANSSLSDQQKRDIMHQVAAGFAGLKYENISVMDMDNGAVMHGSTDPMTAEQQKFYHVKKKYEEELRTKARNLLADYGDVRLEVTVDLDPTIREASEILKYNEKPTTLQTSETKRESSSSEPMEGGRPGAEPNAIANRSASLQGQSQETSKTKESVTEEKKVTGRETTITDKIGLKPTYATISVAIPTSYYKTAFHRKWLDENPDKTTSDLTSIDKTVFVQGVAAVKDEVNKKIQTTLAALVPSVSAGADRFPSVTVTDYLDTPAPVIPGPSMAENLLVFALGSWQWFGMFALAGMALMMLRSFSKTAPVGNVDSDFERGFSIQLEDPSTWDLSALEPELDEDGEEVDENGDRRKFNITGSEIKEELTSMVRENPDAAASLLRSWIGEAA